MEYGHDKLVIATHIMEEIIKLQTVKRRNWLYN
jgi:hypothetical protein